MMDTPKDTPIDPSCPRLAPRLSLLARSFPPLSLIFLWRVRLAQGGGRYRDGPPTLFYYYMSPQHRVTFSRFIGCF